MKRFLVFVMVAIFIIAGCARAEQSQSTDAFRGAGEAPLAPVPEASPKDFGESQEMPASYSNGAERMVIRNANLTIVVAEPAAVMEGIIALADEFGGFVVNSQLYQRSTASGLKVQEASVTIRVPAERLDEARERIKSYVENPKEDILADNISGQDVTQEYTDLQSRLRNEEAAADQLREIMASATKTEDVLRTFNELKAVTEQIEILKGQIKYYEEAAAMSAISVSIQAKETIEPVSVAGWSPKGVARDALQALIDIYQFIASAAIWIVITCLPVALPVGAVVYLIVRGVQKARRKKKARQNQEAGT